MAGHQCDFTSLDRMSSIHKISRSLWMMALSCQLGSVQAAQTDIVSSLDQTTTAPLAVPSGPDPISMVCSVRITLLPLRDLLVATYRDQPDLIMSRQDLIKAEANLLAAKTPFLPAAVAGYSTESFVSKAGGSSANVPTATGSSNTTANGAVAVGNSLVGGASNYMAFPSLGINWNLYNGGHDLALLRGARTGISASDHDLKGTVNDSLSLTLQSLGELAKAHRLLAQKMALRQIRAQMSERIDQLNSRGRANLIKLGQARIALARSERDQWQGCQNLMEKSNNLAKAIGLRLESSQVLRIDDPVPAIAGVPANPYGLDTVIDTDPRVLAAQENIAVAERKVEAARASYYPTLQLSAQYDLLGQSPLGPVAALSSVTSNSYWVGLTLQQSLGPFTTETATLNAAKADLIKARATYQQVVVNTQNHLKYALSDNRRAELSRASAEQAARYAQENFDLTQKLFKNGLTDLDNVDEALIVLLQEQQSAFEAAVDTQITRWLSFRALHPDEFVQKIMKEGGAGIALGLD